MFFAEHEALSFFTYFLYLRKKLVNDRHLEVSADTTISTYSIGPTDTGAGRVSVVC